MAKAPPFTAENAAEMARKSTASRLARLAREKEEAELKRRMYSPETDDARKNRTLVQIDALDSMIDAAIDAGNTRLFLQLSVAKEKLWKLVQPTGGVNKPSRDKPRRSSPVPQPVVSAPQHIDIVSSTSNVPHPITETFNPNHG